MSDDYDSPWKEALDYFFDAFLELVLPDVYALVDWTRGYEMLDKELQQIVPESDKGRLYVDKLVKVFLKSGAEEWILVHVEVQTQKDREFARRMFLYHFRLHERYNRDVLSLAVLADEKPGWRPSMYKHSCMKHCRLTFSFPSVKLLELAKNEEKLEASKNRFAPVVLAHVRTVRTSKDPENRRAYKTELVKNLFRSGMGNEDIRKLFRVIDWLMDLPKPLSNQFWHELKIFKEEKKMPFIDTLERMAIEEREEARAAGLAEGKAQGMSEGKAQGKAEFLAKERNKTLPRLLKLRFGEASLSLLATIPEVPNLETWDLLNDAVFEAPTLQDFESRLNRILAQQT